MGVLIFNIVQHMLKIQDAEMVSNILDHPVHVIVVWLFSCKTNKQKIVYLSSSSTLNIT